MRFHDSAIKKSRGKAGLKPMALASAAPKRMAATKRSAPARKTAAKKPSAKKAAPAKAAKKAAARKPAPQAHAAAAKPVAAKPAPAAPRLATPLSSAGEPMAVPPRAVAAPARPVPTASARPAVSSQSPEERRKAAQRKFFARLRSLEAIVGADLRKRGSLVLMQAVDQWYSEAISATATDVTITNAAKAVITHL